ncbi:hypothetical protein K443DRAFT_581878 [Laccaria amethystina LaAM-08-1]|uniref:Uncharacterized protein n=1 Tax=Laccaria amethystina LaAM-08-1 TaxID=1095629 RepID=A0A0C9WRC6_9AGAR|nr:hypothetical protein K443DRAFT_581878 [Laccaria amethystina LaAM-08-1]
MCNHNHYLSLPNTTTLSQVSLHGTNHALVHPAAHFVEKYQGRPRDECAHEEDDTLFLRGEGREAAGERGLRIACTVDVWSMSRCPHQQ